ncbi:MAG TPA: hypothetical protein ENN63_10190 [Bacteroidetes bacterium]|nr:hypothetical protein [Bacteroidota bacterium]
MKEKHLLKFNMFNRVHEIMDANRNVWKDLPQAVRAYENLKSNLKEIHTLNIQSDRNVSPLLAQLVANRKILTGRLLPVASILQVIAWELRDGKMATRVDLGKKKLKKSDDRKLILRAHQVVEEARRITDLAESTGRKAADPSLIHPVVKTEEYGLTSDKTKALEESLKDFEETYMETRDYLEFNKKCRKRIKQLVKETNRLLKNKLDLLMTLFESDHPDFYAAYLESRQLMYPVPPSEPSPAPKKKGRKRGRPPGSGNTKSKTATGKKKRGRPPKSTGKKRGRPPKNAGTEKNTAADAPGKAATQEKPKRRRGRPPKKAAVKKTEENTVKEPQEPPTQTTGENTPGHE